MGRHDGTMDWLAVASALGERSAQPTVLLDGDGRVRLMNAAFERLLGWSRMEAEGTPWDSVSGSDGTRWLEQAMRGALRSLDASATTRAGVRLVLRLELAIVGRPGNHGLLLAVTDAAPAEPEARPQDDCDYEISFDRDFGRLRWYKSGGKTAQVVSPGATCFSALYGRSKPCDDCPARSDGQPWPRTMARRLDQGPGSAQFEVIAAEKLSASTVRLSRRLVSESALDAIQQAKLQKVVLEAGLSERERDVLHYLLMGRSVGDIATVLQITPRTVKYHQANVLRKVGADSRADLTRFFL
jgi:PAS domain S-box-containing protein